MKTIEYRTTDKSGWGEGPWQAEPDKRQWQDEATRLPCIANRQRRLGFWCGYVGVAPGHPLFGKDYDDVPAEVHGGLTFAGPCQPGGEESGICHVPEPGEPDSVWWLGFDCGHAFDFAPAMNARETGEFKRLYDPATDTWHYPDLKNDDPQWNETYRNLAYVEQQCRELAKQLASAA